MKAKFKQIEANFFYDPERTDFDFDDKAKKAVMKSLSKLADSGYWFTKPKYKKQVKYFVPKYGFGAFFGATCFKKYVGKKKAKQYAADNKYLIHEG